MEEIYFQGSEEFMLNETGYITDDVIQKKNVIQTDLRLKIDWTNL